VKDIVVQIDEGIIGK